MKYFPLLFIAAIFFATSCSKSSQDLLVGTWKANSLKLNTKGSNNQDTVLDFTPFLSFSPTSITFNKCATTCTGNTVFFGNTSNFTYQLSSDEKTINIIDSTISSNVSITELTASSLKVKFPFPSGLLYSGVMDIALTK